MLLAAGRGKRLGHLTEKTPKPLLTIQERPLLEWIILGLRSAGIRRLLCVVGYLAEQIRAHFGDGSRLGMEMDYVEQRELLGTGAALRLGREFCDAGPVLMSFGDILTDYRNYIALAEEWRRSPSRTVMGINFMRDVRAGAAVIRDGSRVIRIIEKPGPADPVSHWNQAGVTVFPAAIWDVLERLPRSTRGEYELTQAVQMLIDEGHEVHAVEFTGFWSDVGTPEALDEARRLWRAP